MRTSLYSVVATVAGLGLIHPAAADVYYFRTVVKTGDPAPGSFAGEFTDFGSLSMNASGQVAFTAQSNSGLANSGIWMTAADNPDELQLVAGTLYPVPDGPANARFGDFDFSFYGPQITDAGDVGFSAPVTGLDANQRTGIFQRIDGTLSKVAMYGDPAPGAGANTTFKGVGNLFTMNQNNIVAFKSLLDGPNVTAANDQALYMQWFGGLNLVKREGGSVPGVPGATFGETSTFYMQVAGTGRVSFHTLLNINGESIGSHWTGWPGALNLLAKGGDPTPIGGWTYSSSTPGVVAGSQSQQGYCFMNSYFSNGQYYPALWYYNTQTQATQALAYHGQPTAYGVLDYISYNSVSTAGDGTTLFMASITNAAADVDRAYFVRKLNQSIQLVAREGDAPYGFWAGVEFDDFADYDYPHFAAVDDTGRIYFTAPVRGLGVNDTNNYGLWAVDADGEIHFVLRRGQWITLNDGVLRQVASFSVDSGLGMHAGRRPDVNNEGHIALKITFTDGVKAIMVAELPGCVGDVNDDGIVNVDDLLAVINSWGDCAGWCPADIMPLVAGNDRVDVEDLLAVINAWGWCP